MNRISVDEMVEKLSNYDIISFDMFDTLILRPFDRPANLFNFLGEKYKLFNFYNLRVKASVQARNNKMQKKRNREVYLLDIYKELQKMCDIDPIEGASYEYEVEKKICYANPYMLEIFNKLIKMDKKIIIVSDMYFNKKQLIEILKKNGFDGYDEIYVSCEYEKSKKEGDLFNTLKQIYNDKKVIHIGDDYISDVENPKRVGWSSFYYEKCREYGQNLRQIGLSHNLFSIYSGIVNNHFYNGREAGYLTNKQYYYGYTYGGLFVLGYINWIYDYVKKHNVDKIIFLSRDGYILQKVFEKMYSEIPQDYIYWSRYSSILSTLTHDMPYFFYQFIDRIKKEEPNMTLEKLLESTDMMDFIKILHKYDLKPNQKLSENQVVSSIKQMFSENKKKLKEIEKKNSIAARKFIEPLIKGNKKICIVDIGWRGTGALSLKHLIEDEWKIDTEVIGLLGGASNSKKTRKDIFFQSGSLKSFMFSPSHNVDLANFHMKNVEIKNTVLEVLVSAPHPSFKKYTLAGGTVLPVFGSEENNSETISFLHKGILDFIKMFNKTSQNLPIKINISGRDAYLPIKYITQPDNLTCFLKYFGEYNFNIYAIDNKSSSSFETLEQRFDKIIKKTSYKKSGYYKFKKAIYLQIKKNRFFFKLYKKFRNRL